LNYKQGGSNQCHFRFPFLPQPCIAVQKLGDGLEPTGLTEDYVCGIVVVVVEQYFTAAKMSLNISSPAVLMEVYINFIASSATRQLIH
jgi:hypothetical protein